MTLSAESSPRAASTSNLRFSDLINNSDIPLTHDLMATMLGVHRPTVTLALRSLHKAGLVDENGGLVLIRDRRVSRKLVANAIASCEPSNGCSAIEIDSSETRRCGRCVRGNAAPATRSRREDQIAAIRQLVIWRTDFARWRESGSVAASIGRSSIAGRHPVHSKGRIMLSRHHRLREAATLEAVTAGNQGTSTTVSPDASKPVDRDDSRFNSGPQDGDVVVRREARSPICFSVRQLPVVVQLGTSSRDEALRLAREFAQEHAVDVWYDDEGTFRLLEAYRARTGIQRIDRNSGRRP